MDIKNVTITTETKYESTNEDNGSDYRTRGQSVDYLVISVIVPGGKAIYELKIDSDFRKSLEKAVGLK